MDSPLVDAVDALRLDHATAASVEDRTIRLTDPVNGDPGFAVLRALGIAQAASPVGAAAHGPNGVAAGVWRNPELYIARWSRGRRWVVAYRLTGASRVNDYVRTEGRLPTRFETANWYGPVPDEVTEAFLEAGLLLDDPPFPLPPPPPPRPSRPSRAVGSGSGSRLRPPAATRPPGPPRATRSAPSPSRPAGPEARVCPACHMRKAPGQFIPGSDLCADCR